MAAFHIIRTVTPNAARNCSYPVGKIIVLCAQNSASQADRAAALMNEFAMPGVSYEAAEYDDSAEPTLPLAWR